MIPSIIKFNNHRHSFVKIEETEDSDYKFGYCGKVCKSKGGLKIHNRKKHPEASESAQPTQPDNDKMASDNLTPPLLENMISEILSQHSKGDTPQRFKMQSKIPKSKHHMVMLFTKSVSNVWHLCTKRMTQESFMKYSIHLCHYRRRHC